MTAGFIFIMGLLLIWLAYTGRAATIWQTITKG